jgi:hypothetical protein
MIKPFYYFGCRQRSGHYVFAAAGSPPLDYYDIPIPKLDGSLPPPGDPWGKPGQVQGRARLHHINGWTAVAYWDRSVDERGGSNSVFLAPGVFSFEEIMASAREAFPDVLDRISFKIELAA